MQSINALSLAPDVNDWLANSRHPHILHIFDNACNLIDERREVLSIVMSEIGNGPFNLVIEGDILFSDHLHAQSPISIHTDQITLGDLTIHTGDAKLWPSRPDWEMLHAKRDDIINQLMALPIDNYRQLSDAELPNHQHFPITPTTNSLISTLAIADFPSSIAAARQLAGLGIGLTPSGDDFILGAMLAAWIVHPFDVARVLAEEITNTAAPLTTSLSAAWLRSAGRGEAGILWHNFFNALISDNPMTVQASMEKLLAVGHTSGADSLSGFIGVFMSWMQHEKRS